MHATHVLLCACLLHCLIDIGFLELTLWLLERQQSGADARTLVPSQMQVKQMYDCWSHVVVLQPSDPGCMSACK